MKEQLSTLLNKTDQGQFRLLQRGCLSGTVFWQIAGNTTYCAQMTVESIEATYIVYKYITLLWTD